MEDVDLYRDSPSRELSRIQAELNRIKNRIKLSSQKEEDVKIVKKGETRHSPSSEEEDVEIEKIAETPDILF